MYIFINSYSKVQFFWEPVRQKMVTEKIENVAKTKRLKFHGHIYTINQNAEF